MATYTFEILVNNADAWVEVSAVDLADALLAFECGEDYGEMSDDFAAQLDADGFLPYDLIETAEIIEVSF